MFMAHRAYSIFPPVLTGALLSGSGICPAQPPLTLTRRRLFFIMMFFNCLTKITSWRFARIVFKLCYPAIFLISGHKKTRIVIDPGLQ